MRVLTRCPHISGRLYVSGKRGADLCKVNFFKFGKNGADAASAGFGNLQRDDFDQNEMEQYFNYTGRLAVEKTYDSFNEYVKKGMHPVDVILLWASEESDGPKVEEVLSAGADPTVTDLKGKTPLELATDEGIKELLKEAVSKKAETAR
jgi:hypothetical protein